ncbi:MAG: DNA recombination protein RmuC [Alphaproteobacteria bacterium]|nr:DNA recombination protein RmuC [Alphaproteobacteria bacterium]
MTSAIVYSIASFVFGLLLAGAPALLRILKLERENAQMAARMGDDEQFSMKFDAAAQRAVRDAHETFLQLAQERLGAAHKDGAHDLEKRQKAIEMLISPVQEHLKALGGALEQSRGVQDALRQDIKNLNMETARLVGALRDPAAQGAWGEFILEGLLENSGLIKGVHYDTQVSMAANEGRQRPDAVIHMQDGFNIIIDAKAPLNEFAQRLSEDISESEYKQLMQNLARQIRLHVQALGKKGYWENLESPDFTVMFLPSEQMYSLALRADPTLVEFAAQKNVIIASPTLLMSLLRVVGMSWRQMELAKNAAEISERGADLYKRLLKFSDHMGKIGSYLQNAVKGYNEAVGSLERSVLPAGRKFRDLQALTGEKDLPEQLAVSEEPPRLVTLSAEDEAEKKRA